MKKLKKAALWTDSHWGRKNNSEQHNKDCMEFVLWFIEIIKSDPEIDHLVFLGDFFENRSAVNIATLNEAYNALTLLNVLNLPIFMLVGNHDMFLKNHRVIHSTATFDALSNIMVINEPTFIDYVGTKGALFAPFLLPDEFIKYRELINSSNVVFSHFELNGFVITGDSIVMEHATDPDTLNGPCKIFCGHFHRRQFAKNIIYIGSNMALDFSDANDNERGCCTYDHVKDKLTFINYENSPTYITTSLTKLLDDPSILKPKATVKCLADTDITLEEASTLKEKFMKAYSLRDFQFEEPTMEALKNTDMDLTGLELESTNKIVVNLLGRINEPKINSNTLIKIWRDL